jgi:hypothetical protein
MVDSIIVRWIGRQKVPGCSANRIATWLFAVGPPASVRSATVSPLRQQARTPHSAGLRSGASDQKVRQQNVNDEGNFSARPRASPHASKFGAAQHAAHPQWARRSGLRGAAELCGVYCRKSSEMRFTEAAFSVAKTVLPSDLAM